ncbi:gliding motility-associated C-terminal domain-containing protein [Flavobacterium sp. MAH-1]|uniref:Gliding motility-associated C-terminal domain-containing protein n=1 Tax=Flavobacterium agri TaxID=2743471 RepID=A0A7Y8XZD1_9FLAO|nr:gliding motility-associated C-terminal domain-containing protein [Flavobacterium agri]NUY79707.1 gliding motility-associated C-terminal domain-containing protein [Flavobacterium agri]NYA69732.1 gliding motility-associated C-terminal domain-containing protein [Flavobacterium agri]
MKNIYFKSKIATPKFLMLLLTALLGFTFAANAQVRVPFTQRTSQFSPTKKIYSIKGDFTMMGNTNLTLQNYGDLTQNGNNTMVYVDVDSPTATGLGGTQTFNSSSATLGLSTENGAVPSCSNIIYAGLYWTGRAGNSSPNNNTFSVTKSSPAPGAALNQTQTVDHNEDIASSNYDMTVSRQGGSNARYPRYRFSNGTTEYDFIFQNDNTVSVRINGGTYSVIGSTVATNGSNKTATLTTPYVINDGFVVITINSFTRPSSTNLSEGDYQSGSTASVHIGGNANSTLDVTKNFDKRKIQFKGPGASSYSEFTANASDIYYPTTQDDYMYSAYAEVTDYVKTHGLGEYTAADIALIEGNGGGTGYYGGWGLIVVYENSKMKYRDVTIFDGHAYVIGGTASNDLPISGFNTVQAGPVGIKLGLMAGEGDNGISGDYFQIQRQDNSTWQSLNHSANSTGNFFNSSIQTAGARTPNLVNNTGLDISMFNLPNTGNGLITNNQTSTTFRYGSTQDTYIIFAIAMAVDAYIPDVEGDLSAVSINNVPVPAVGPYTALPGQEMEFKINVRNRGTEAINNAKLTIPIPYNTEYVNNSAVRQVFFTPAPTPNSLTFNPAIGSNGSVVWDIGTLPVPANPDTILGTLTFRISVTTDCELLKNANCQNIVAVNGSFTGSGAITGIVFNDRDLIQGYTTNGTCQGTAISAPLLVNVNAQDYVNTHCQSTPPITAFTFCSTGAAIPITAVSGSFPNGSTFYNQYPVGPNTTQYTISNPFPATLGTQTYYAVPPGALNGCFFQFTITVTTINTTPTVAGPVNYCQGANASPLTATPSSPGLTLYYYLTQNGQPQMSITPATGNVGTFTYYVAEAQSPTCIGPKVPITVNVYPAPAVTAPTNATFNGCGPDVITGLTYSTSPVTITLAQFQAAGGNISNVANIGNYTITYTDVRSGNCPVVVTRTFTVTSACGNVNVTQTINIMDSTPPVIAGLPAEPTTLQCPETPTWVTPSATDNCEGLVTLTSSDTTVQGNCGGSYTITRTWTATDLCGNVATATQVYNVVDTTAPVISQLPAATTIDCPATPSWTTPTATDTCGGNVTLTSNDVTTPGSCPNSYTIVRTWTATDACGNTATASQTINVQDITAPTITTQAQNLTIQCTAGNQNALNQWLASNGGAVASDSCSAVTWSNNFTTIGTDCSAAVTVMFTATDACGNTATTSATFTVSDTTAPVAPAAPANVNVACASQVPANVTLTAQDNCSGAIAVQGTDVTTPGNCPNSFTIVRTWTFTDACGNSSSVSQTINVNDTVAPVAPAAPANVTAQCSAQVPANVTLTAQDNCQGAIEAQGVDVTTPGACAGSFTIVRTWTFADACGNTSSVSQTITVNDTVVPVAPQAPANVTAACASEVPANVALTAQDNCQGAITVEGVDVTTPGNCPNSFTIVRTWTFADACGNTSSVSQTITVNDNVAPVAPQAPANVTAACASEVPANVALTAQDNCSGAITAQGVDVTTPGNCPNSFTIVRTWTFVDACGNSSSVSQTINVNDTVAPVAPTAPANVTAQCSAEVPANVTLTAQDNCSGAITAQGVDVTTPGNCPNSFTIVRTWTFVDACGNSSSVSQTISVNDNVAPVAPEAPANVTVACASEVPANVTLTAQDNCQGAITAQGVDVTTPGQCANSFTIVRTWTFADACGNTSSVSQTISVNDNIAPTISELPAATTIDCPATPSWTTPTATDNCSGAVQLTSNDVTTPGSCSNAYTIVRTWTATDACGNVATASQTINVQDITAPVITAQAQNLTIQCGANQNALNDWLASNGGAAATDSCSAVTWTNNYNGIGNDCSAAITVIFTATDACGNASTTSATFTVSDTTAPVAPAAPANVTVQCTANVPANVSLTAVDNCAGNITVQGVDVTTPGACAASFTIVRTWTFVDACANTSSVSQTITVNDTTAPVAPQAPANVTAACASEVPANVALTAQDNCQGAITVEGVDVTTPGNCPNSFVIVRTWTFADACGNTSSVSQTITVNDNVAPVAPAAPANVTAACASEIPANVTLTAQDNCQGAITAEGVDVTTPGNCPNSFTIVRTWTFTDACGNTSSVSQTISVNDNVAPVAPQAPVNVTASCSAEVPANVTLTAQDNCSGTIEAQGVDVTTPGACAGSFTIVRTWTFTDACGNTSSVSQTISVNDTVAPVAPEAPANVTAQCAAEVPANVTLTATDNCGEVITAQGVDVTTPGNCANSFVIVRTWTFADACGNTSSVSQTITVNDNIAPVISELPAATTIDCPATPAFAQATATDNCAGDVNLTFEDVTTQGQCAGSYSITRTWTATDACGNTATATQTINVQDITAPTITAEAQNLAIQCGAGNENALNDWLASNGGATATDACSAVTWTNNYNGIGNDCTSAVTVIFTATDACGNASTTSATFTVSDTTAPVAPEAPAAVTVQCAADVPANVTLTATDNCAGNIAVQGVDVTTPGQCAGSYTIVRTWTFVDACANSVSVSQTITVNDTVAPVAPEAPANVNVSCAGEVPSSVTLTAQDNCQGAITAEGVDVVTPGSCPNSFTVVRTWTFTDACGNSSSVSQTINVNDTVAPVAPEAPANVTAQCTGEVPANVTLTAIDNCGEQIAAQGVDVTTPGQCEGSFTIVRTWTFTDACGNSSSVSQTISVNDTTAPVAPQAPANVTLACAGDVPANVSLTATDNCGGEITAEGVDVTTPGNCANSFVIVRTWTFADACGNTSSVSQTITVNDNVAPVIAELPATSTIECPATPEFAQATATDNCAGDVTLTFEDATTQGQCAGSYSITRTWTATDACGNTATATQTINVQDTTAPTITAEAQNLAIQCGTGNENALEQWLASNGGATATDSCSNVTWANNYNGIGNDCSAAVTVIFTATDACGNASTTSATFTISDTTAPVAPEAPANVTVACAAEVPANVSLTAIDNCLGEISVQGVDVTTAGQCAGTYTIVRTWTFTDACANTTSISQTINVIDNVAPTASEAPANATVQCGDALPENVTLTATDNCGEQISAQGVDVQTAGECPGTYTIVRTWTFADACGNTSSVSQTINVIDTVAPVAPTAPESVTAQCAGEVPAAVTLTAVDACGGNIEGVMTEEITKGACVNSFNIVRTWTFTDACGNASTVTQTISVNDNVAPVAPEAPADVTAQCAGEVPANVTLTAQDNCNGAIAVEGVDVVTAGNCPNSFTIVRTWTFTDACGNTSSVSQNISVNDTTAPVAPEAPADVTASCGGEVPANVTLTAQDNCNGTISAEGVDVVTKGACPNSYTIVRTWTFTDACGNTSSVSQNISVGDTTAPVLPENVPANVTVSCASEVPAAVTLTATDNCSETPITVEAVDSVAPGNCANSFVITRTWTFADACGNTSVATQVITVNDTTAPTFNEPTPADVTLSCDEIPAAATLTAVDNCGNVAVAVTMTETTTQGTCAGSYTLTRTWSATDACGNVATVSQDINVIDNDAPTFVETTPAPAITAECGQVPAPAVLTAVDGCNAAPNAVVYAESSVPGQCPVTEIITRTWTATDACGNVQSFTQIVTVQDTTAPTVNETLEPVVNVTCDQVPAVPTLTFSDACSTVGTPVFTEVITEPVGGNYSITWTWVVADACNNTATFTQVVNVTISNSEVTVNRDECNQDSSLSIDLTTLLPAGTPAGGTFVNVDGVLGLNGNTLTPFQTPNGTYTIDYVVDDVTCPRVVHIEMNLNETFCEVDPACTVTVNNAFSPNNDGINEVFNISGFENTECVVSNNVEIYNRWGILVFEMKNYNNNDRAFRGVSEGRVTLKKDDELPTGTYFYIISYKKADGTSGKLDGYLYLSR